MLTNDANLSTNSEIWHIYDSCNLFCNSWVIHPLFVPLQTCLQRSFNADVQSCPTCRHELGKDFSMATNKALSAILKELFPGYEAGR